jgi:pimeloyl-ACP methyl ester carboxylesterase
MTVVRANGVALHVQEVPPSGPPTGTAVLIHGMAGDNMASWYLTLAHPLADAGMRVLLYDLRGHGRSERPPRGYAFDDFVDDLSALLDHWHVDGRVHLFGNSFGGTVAFGYAARHPERVAGIVAIDSAPPTPAWFGRMGRRLSQAAAFQGPGGRRVRDTLALLTETSLGAELPASRLPEPSAFAAITCPVLCLYGGTSGVRQLAPETERLLPQTRSVVLDGAKHTLLVDRHSQVGDHVLPWLRSTRLSPAEGNAHG